MTLLTIHSLVWFFYIEICYDDIRTIIYCTTQNINLKDVKLQIELLIGVLLEIFTFNRDV